MANKMYEVLAGIDYPPNKRAEAGDQVSDLPESAIPWLLSSGIIKESESTKAPEQSDKPTAPITAKPKKKGSTK